VVDSFYARKLSEHVVKSLVGATRVKKEARLIYESFRTRKKGIKMEEKKKILDLMYTITVAKS